MYDPQLLSYRASGIDVIACNHHNAYTSGFGFCNGLLDLRTHRVDHTGKTHKAHIVLERLRIEVFGRVLMPITTRSCDHTKRTICKRLVLTHDIFTDLLRQRNNALFRKITRAMRKHYIGSTFGMLHIAIVCAHNHAHHFAT